MTIIEDLDRKYQQEKSAQRWRLSVFAFVTIFWMSFGLMVWMFYD